MGGETSEREGFFMFDDMLCAAKKEIYKKERAGSAGKVIAGITVGAAVGVVLGLLAAPKSGRETRKELKAKADKAADCVNEKLEETGEMLNKACEMASDEIKDEEQTVADWGESQSFKSEEEPDDEITLEETDTEAFVSQTNNEPL